MECGLSFRLRQMFGVEIFGGYCQGKTYKEARDAGYIFAPEKTKKGAILEHWRRVNDVKKGDIILHWAKPSAIMAIGVAIEDAKIRGPSTFDKLR